MIETILLFFPSSKNAPILARKFMQEIGSLRRRLPALVITLTKIFCIRLIVCWVLTKKLDDTTSILMA